MLCYNEFMTQLKQLIAHPQLLNLDKKLTPVFAGFPHLPKSAKDILVKIAPYLTLIAAIVLALNAVQLIFGSQTYNWAAELVGYRQPNIIYFYILAIFQALIALLYFTAYKPLQGRQFFGWQSIFAAACISVLISILEIIFIRFNVLSLVLSTLLTFYVLYELKDQYQGKSSPESAVKKSKNKK